MADKFHGGGGVKPARIDVSVPVELRKTTDSTAQTGKIFSDITASYWRQGGTPTSITPVTLAAITTAHADGGFKEADATKNPGAYRLDLPDAAVATGVDWVVITVTCAGCFDYSFFLALETKGAADLQDVAATSIVTGGAITTSGGAVSNVTLAGTVTTLTNLPAITNNWLTAAGIAANALNGKGDWLLSTSAPANFSALGINASGHLSRVTLTDTITTYTGNTVQTGDSFARIGALGAGLTALAPSATALSTAVWTGTKAGFIDGSILSRMATFTYTAPDSAATITSAVWAAAARSLTDKAGFSLSGTVQTFDALNTVLSSTHGEGSWATPTGFSTITAQEVWEYATRTLSAGTNIVLPANALGNISAWTVNLTGALSGSVGSVTAPVAVTGDTATAATRFLTMIALNGGAYRYTLAALALAPTGGGGGGGGMALTDVVIADDIEWDENTVGWLLALSRKLYDASPSGEVIPIPALPADSTARTVYGGAKLPTGAYAVGANIVFKRLTAGVNSGWVVTNDDQTATVDSAGLIAIDLELGTYAVHCPRLGLNSNAHRLTVGTENIDFGAWLASL